MCRPALIHPVLGQPPPLTSKRTKRGAPRNSSSIRDFADLSAGSQRPFMFTAKLNAVRLRRRHYLPAIFHAGRQRLLAQQMLAPSGRRQRDPLLLHARHRHVDDIHAGIVQKLLQAAVHLLDAKPAGRRLRLGPVAVEYSGYRQAALPVRRQMRPVHDLAGPDYRYAQMGPLGRRRPLFQPEIHLHGAGLNRLFSPISRGCVSRTCLLNSSVA